MKRESLTDKQHYWLTHVKAAESSPLSATDYAEKNGVDLKALYNWKSSFKKQGLLDSSVTPSSFVPIKADSPATRTHKAIANTGAIIELPNGVKIQAEQLTADILTALRGL